MEKKEPPRRINSLSDRTEIVESALDRAIKRGDFDDLPGMGKPLRGLHNSEDPDWWIKQKLDSEDISGVAPAAFQLRKENAVLEDTLDEFARESDVRAYLAGFTPASGRRSWTCAAALPCSPLPVTSTRGDRLACAPRRRP